MITDIPKDKFIKCFNCVITTPATKLLDGDPLCDKCVRRCTE